jgi:hypothetical protein
MFDLLLLHDTVINLRNNYLYHFVHLHIVYFAEPGQVQVLTLNPCSVSIIVNWEKPISNSYCVKNYIIEWVNSLGESGGNHEVPCDVFSYSIEDLDAFEEYEVSVRAVDAKGEGADAVTAKKATESAGNYHTHIILLCL